MKVVTVEYAMYFGANPAIFKKAKELRKFETESEQILWARLKKNQLLGLQFRRQHPINRFIADFYCHKIKLVIEVDGGVHELPENKAYDIGRTEMLNEFGVQVIRFANKQIIDDIEKVVIQIKQIAQNLLSGAQKVPQIGDLGGYNGGNEESL